MFAGTVSVIYCGNAVVPASATLAGRYSADNAAVKNNVAGFIYQFSPFSCNQFYFGLLMPPFRFNPNPCR